MIKKSISLILVCVFLCLAFSGCGGETEEGKTNKITWWLPAYGPANVKDYEDVQVYKEIEKKFGVEIEFIHPVKGQEAEQFNIMIASGEYPDVVTYDWNAYPGGAVKAASDGVIQVLDNYVEDSMPNFKAIMNENATIKYAAKNYDGAISVIPSMTDNVITNSCYGIQIRKDWLDKLGLNMPETIDEWYNVLTAFKNGDPNGNGKKDEIPLLMDKNAAYRYLAMAWGGFINFHINTEGEVVFGFMEDSYKQFLATMNKWYEEGLFDAEYASSTTANLEAKMTTNQGGAYIGYSGSSMGNFISIMKKENPDYKLVAAPWPKDSQGVMRCGYHYQPVVATSGKGTAITTANKNVEKSIEIIDYLYSEEGSILMNWGIEGVTYEIENGEFKFKEEITKNAEGKSPVEALSPYALTNWTQMMRSDAFVALNTLYPEQREAMEIWSKADTSLFLPGLTFSPEESEQITEVMDDIYGYCFEWVDKFVMGIEPMSKYDDVVAQIKNLNIDKAIKVYQTAYDRYKNQ